MLIVVPHPDDGEFFCSQLCLQAVKAKFEVHEVISCCDEYGTFRNDFKGKRIHRIRRSEMIRAAKVYGTDENGESLIKLHWMNYIDGFVPHNEEVVDRLRKFILKIKPDLITGPDPFIYFDGHRDHIATGKNYYHALESMDPGQRPKTMLFFQTLMPDFFLPITNKKLGFKAWNTHTSQMSLIGNLFWKIKPILFISRLIRNATFPSAEGYRRVRFNQESHIPNGISKLLFDNLFSGKGFGDTDPNLFKPGPKELGLNTEPEGDIE